MSEPNTDFPHVPWLTRQQIDNRDRFPLEQLRPYIGKYIAWDWDFVTILDSDEDWRRYEWTYVFNLDRYVSEHPHEEGLDELCTRLERVRSRQLLAAREGEVLGFALVAWRKPSA